MNKIFISVLLMVVALLCAHSPTYAICPENGVTPISVGAQHPQNGFPAILRDTNGFTAELCLDGDGLNGPCIYDPPDQNNPFSVQVGFGPEAFWWSADSSIDQTAVGLDGILVLAAEAAWANEVPVNGQQFPFTRLRVRVSVPAPGIYTIVHPYGQEIFNVAEIGPGNEINMSRDIEIVGFNTSHDGAIGPFLRWTDPDFPYVDQNFPGNEYFGNPLVDHTVTGSPCGTNFFRIIGPAGVDLDGNLPGIQTQVTQTLFSLQGKISDLILPPPLSVERSTYSRTNPGQVDVWATSLPLATVTVSGGPNLPASPTLMSTDGAGNFFSSIPVPNSALLPSFVTVIATDPDGITSINSNLIDVVTVTKAEYDMSTDTLTVEAVSSDGATPVPTLSIPGLGSLTAGILVAQGMPLPPPTVTVNSSRGGSDTEPVKILPTLLISGRITRSDNAQPLQGVQVSLTGGASAVTTTNASGDYVFTGLTNGSYTVTPALAGFTFAPVSQVVNLAGADATGVNFTATPAAQATFSISGRVTTLNRANPSGLPFAGVTITVAQGAATVGTAITDANGDYTVGNLANGSYRVTPSRPGSTFTPVFRNVTVNTSNVTGVNFTSP